MVYIVQNGCYLMAKSKEEVIIKTLLMEFDWRWKAFLKDEYTQKQFATGYRKILKRYIDGKDNS